VASKKITGEWILYTDADVHLRQGTLRKAIALCTSCSYDHFSLLPKVYTFSFWHEIALRSFGFLLLQDIRNLNFCGIGAFNLVKRSCLERTEGFPWLRMEVADDMGLALLLQRSGAKNGYAFAFHHVSLSWYPSMGTVVRGLAKNTICAAQYSLYKSFIFAICLWAIVAGPILVLLHPGLPYLSVLGIGAYGLLGVSAVVAHTRLREDLLPSLFLPAGLLFISLIVLRSGIVCKLRGGVSWRGTFYKTEDLIMGQRFK
jgi:cellulose synthase/poly-beta-1,6-N-acetylglucosamine synthase-like glycosyltransferase